MNDPVHPGRRELLAAALLLAGGVVAAQDLFPKRPVKLILPWPPGGSSELPARLLADGMAKNLGQPVVIDHRPGATGQIGANFVKSAEPDGYTLLYANFATHALNPVVERNLRYDPWGDFTPVILAAQVPVALLVRGAGDLRTLADLKTLSNTKGDLTLATIGVGSASLFLGIMLEEVTGIRVRPVPYKGEALAVQDLLGGHVDIVFAATAPQYVGNGGARPILTSGTDRWKAMPGIPTFAEATGTANSMTAWNGIVAPKRTPADIVRRLNEAANKALKDPGVVERLETAGLQVVGGAPETFESRSRADIAMLAAFAKRHASKIEAARQ